MKPIYVLIFMLTVMSFPNKAAAKDVSFGPVTNIILDGLKRQYSTHLPKGHENDSDLPLVIVLHGAKGSYKKSQGFTGMNQVSDNGKFIAVYPNAYNTQWNDGRLPGDTPSYKVNDIHFIETLIELFSKHHHIDRSRVYLVGFSSGGMMSQRFAMERAHKVAAIVPIASTIPVPQMKKGVTPALPVPVMMVNGTHDPAFPWNGGRTRFAGIRVGAVSAVEDTLAYWLNANGGAASSPKVEALPQRVNDGTSVEKIAYQTQAGPNVILYKVIQGGHSWPGARYPATYLPRFLYGKTSQQFNASEAAWHFLKHYSRLPEAESTVQPLPSP